MTERFPGLNEEPVIPDSECRRIAEVLLKRHEKELLAYYAADEVDGVKWPAARHGVLEHHIRNISPEILEQYWGHGITRGNSLARLTAAISVLSNNAMVGDMGHLGGGGGYSAYTQGDFLVLSKRGRQLMVRENPKNPQSRPIFIMLGENENTGREIRAVKIDPSVFVVNSGFYPLVGELQKMFPGKKIIRANELKQHLEHEAKN